MAVFEYSALDSNGKRQKGVIESDSLRQARIALKERMLTPLRMHESSKGQYKKWFSANIGLRDLSEITRQLAIMLQSGLQIEQALNAISRQHEKHIVKTTLASVRSRVMEGKTLAASLAAFPGSFSELFRASVDAGERTGHIDIVLGQLADFMENSYQTRQKVVLALLYPFILVIVSLLIIAFLMTFIVPDMIKIFADSGYALPLLTRALIALSHFTQDYGVFFLLLILGCIWSGAHFMRRQDVRLRCDKKLLQLPVIGSLVLQYNCTRFVSTLGMMQESGVALLQALEIADAVLTNSHIRASVVAIRKQVSEGVSLSRAMEQAHIFPPVFTAMTTSGEASGKLGNMLIRAGSIGQRDTENRISLLIGLFEPLVLLMMGVIVLLLVLAIILPILNLNKLV